MSAVVDIKMYNLYLIFFISMIMFVITEIFASHSKIHLVVGWMVSCTTMNCKGKHENTLLIQHR